MGRQVGWPMGGQAGGRANRIVFTMHQPDMATLSFLQVLVLVRVPTPQLRQGHACMHTCG